MPLRLPDDEPTSQSLMKAGTYSARVENALVKRSRETDREYVEISCRLENNRLLWDRLNFPDEETLAAAYEARSKEQELSKAQRAALGTLNVLRRRLKGLGLPYKSIEITPAWIVREIKGKNCLLDVRLEKRDGYPERNVIFDIIPVEIIPDIDIASPFDAESPF